MDKPFIGGGIGRDKCVEYGRESMRAFRIAYDGTRYSGFQRQPDAETIEGDLFCALGALSVLDEGESKPEGYAAAGRTDKGVSARAQTISFTCPEWLTPRALNARLPASIRAWASADVDGFHATHDARSREYTYYCHAPDVDRTRAKRAVRALSGTHDFHNLTTDERNTTRTLAIVLERDGPFQVYRVRAKGFPRQLVRRLVTLIVGVSTGELPFSRIERALSAERLSGPAGIGPAPGFPLVLTDVEYPNTAFEIDERAAASLREVFAARRIERETRARVAGVVGAVSTVGHEGPRT